MANNTQSGIAINDTKTADSTLQSSGIVTNAETRQLGGHGFAMEEQHPIVASDTSVGGSNVNHSMFDSVLQDKSWTLADLVSKPTIIGSFTWDDTQNIGTQLFTLSPPWCSIVTPALEAAYKNMLFSMGTFHIRVTIQSTRFNAGKLICAFFPGTHPEETNSPSFFSMARLTSVEHSFIDAAIINSVEMEIPFSSMLNRIENNELLGDNLFNQVPWIYGTFTCRVFNDLRVPTGANTILNGIVTTWIEGADFSTPLSIVGSTLPSVTAFNNLNMPVRDFRYLSKLSVKERKAALSVLGLPEAQTGIEGITSGGNTTININDGPVATKPAEQDKGSGSNLFSSIISGLAPVLGALLDFPNQFFNKDAFIRQPFGYTANGRGVSHAQRMDIDPELVTSVPTGLFHTVNDEMDLMALAARPTLVTQFEWETNDAAAAILYSGRVAINNWTSMITPADTEVSFGINLIDYISLPFTYWHGAIKFSISIAANMLATGKLMVEYHPGISTLPVGIIDGTSQYCYEIELANETREWMFELPYLTGKDRTRIVNGIPTLPSTVEDFGYWNDSSFYNGLLVFRVVVPLQVIADSPTTITINLFSAAGTGYGVDYLGLGGSSIMPFVGSPTEFLPYPVVQSGTFADAPEIPSMEQMVQQGQMLGPVKDKKVKSDETMVTPYLGDMIKRFTPIDNTIITNPTISLVDTGRIFYQAFPVRPPVSLYTPVSTQNMGAGAGGLFGYYGNMFRWWKGDLRYKILFNFPNNTGVSATAPNGRIRGENSLRGFAMYTPHMAGRRNTSEIGGLLSSVLPRYKAFSDSTIAGTSSQRFVDVFNVRETSGTSNVILPFQMDVGGRGPVAFCDQNAPYIELEVPYNSIFNKLMTNTVITHKVGENYAFDKYYADELTTMGTLIVGMYDMCGPSDDSPVFQGSWQTLIAAGDSFKFGGFIGQPPVVVRKALDDALITPLQFSVYPDLYV